MIRVFIASMWTTPGARERELLYKQYDHHNHDHDNTSQQQHHTRPII